MLLLCSPSQVSALTLGATKMVALSLLVFPLSGARPPVPPPPSSSSSKTAYGFSPVFSPDPSLKSTHRRTAIRSHSDGPENESRFLDEEGVVDDMDGYLNYLSLEYDSVWDTKPSWCQPWTIMLTGVIAVASSWLLHSVVVTAIVVFLICAWWYIFLYSYPKAYADMIAERRKKVRDGVEDTFGLGKTR
ncbi:uncharacterized protein LOC127798235 [Diospyros lotus]|uniref:uncharacterized protein LOC127798235 n=1 Tax=Diospyros lotus TaxID=55363 RepID=UPI00225924B9|nr:uncharacterized protein LOC127798235 [Diospyros lotus]